MDVMNYGRDEMHAHFIKRHEMSLHLFTILAKNTGNVKVMKCPPISTPQRDKNSNSKPGQTKETSTNANPNINKTIKDRRSGCDCTCAAKSVDYERCAVVLKTGSVLVEDRNLCQELKLGAEVTFESR